MAQVTTAKTKGFANHELVTLAIFLLGGEAKPVDLEDIAMRANEMAPGRFAWRKYPTQINIKNIDAFLWDAKKLKNGNYVVNSGKDEWVLTPTGVAFARERIAGLQGVDVSRKALSARDKNWLRSERERMLGSPAFAKFRAGELDRVNEQEVEAFFRLDSYVTGKAREQKLLRIINVFGEDGELGAAVKALEIKVRKN
jgi:hypothetical protein